MSAPHVAAIVSRLANGPAGSLRVFEAAPTSPVYPYVVVYADGGIRSSDREADVRVRKTMAWQTTVVGTSQSQCRSALDRVTAALEDWTPTLTGWDASKVEHDSSQPVREDADLPDRVLYIATDQWSVVFDPA